MVNSVGLGAINRPSEGSYIASEERTTIPPEARPENYPNNPQNYPNNPQNYPNKPRWM